MTIDDNVEFLNEVKDFFEDIANNSEIEETIKVYFTIESLETAIGTMRKYQKIEQITRDFQQIHPHYGDSYYLQIREVIENENGNEGKRY